ncbi:MAG: 3-oxoacyl-[acyl-carrier-protein] reductase [Candidatus Kapabacteria bacterium]|nr:3-oxoacyl-[acyl-carrier-protein] reductase [Candidatus Kapabacteria bacterium]
MKRFTGKTVIVTGGCRGIGLSIVERFANEGARVFALDYVIPESGTQLFDNEELNSLTSYLQADVTKEESVKAAIDEILKTNPKIEILVNNAGITRDNLVLRMTEADWDSVLSTNLKGAFICTKVLVRTMMAQRFGRIINIGSVVGTMGNIGQANYSASKAGLIGFTKSIAREFASRNILVNCVAPGYVRTPMTEKLSDDVKQNFMNSIPLKRLAEPSDIANVVCFFASDDASYLTGQLVHVDGGMAM